MDLSQLELELIPGATTLGRLRNHDHNPGIRRPGGPTLSALPHRHSFDLNRYGASSIRLRRGDLTAEQVARRFVDNDWRPDR